MLTKQEIRQLGNKEMMEELLKSRRELLKSQFEVRNGTSKEVHVVKNLKRYIAQLQTLAQEMKLEIKPGMSKSETPAPANEEKKSTPVAKKTPKKTTAASKSTKAPVAKKSPATKTKVAKK
jgi:ribosomal protein L29